jgi:hypothetical protein
VGNHFEFATFTENDAFVLQRLGEGAFLEAGPHDCIALG